MEAERFGSQGAKMGTSQALQLKMKATRKKVVEQNITYWKKAKERMESYAAAIGAVSNSFNFVYKVEPPATQPFELEQLELTLHLPTTINTRTVMNQ